MGLAPFLNERIFREVVDRLFREQSHRIRTVLPEADIQPIFRTPRFAPGYGERPGLSGGNLNKAPRIHIKQEEGLTLDQGQFATTPS